MRDLRAWRPITSRWLPGAVLLALFPAFVAVNARAAPATPPRDAAAPPPFEAPSRAEDAPGDASPDAASPAGPPEAAPPGGGARVLLLPSIRAAGGRELSPWTAPAEPAENDRFARLEEALAAALADAGFEVIDTSAALAESETRDLLTGGPQPLTHTAAAEAARAANARVALIIRAEAIRGRAAGPAGPAGLHTTDALVEATAYRAEDSLRLARATTRVSGSGEGERAADAEALAHAARPIASALAAPMAAALSRPIVQARPLTVTLQGRLNWREYRRLRQIIRDAVPEFENLEERRFTRGRVTLMGRCGCEAGEAAGRLNGITRSGLRLSATAEEGGLRIQAEAIGVAPAPVSNPKFH